MVNKLSAFGILKHGSQYEVTQDRTHDQNELVEGYTSQVLVSSANIAGSSFR